MSCLRMRSGVGRFLVLIGNCLLLDSLSSCPCRLGTSSPAASPIRRRDAPLKGGNDRERA